MLFMSLHIMIKSHGRALLLCSMVDGIHATSFDFEMGRGALNGQRIIFQD